VWFAGCLLGIVLVSGPQYNQWGRDEGTKKQRVWKKCLKLRSYYEGGLFETRRLNLQRTHLNILHQPSGEWNVKTIAFSHKTGLPQAMQHLTVNNYIWFGFVKEIIRGVSDWLGSRPGWSWWTKNKGYVSPTLPGNYSGSQESIGHWFQRADIAIYKVLSCQRWFVIFLFYL
jgi:hypothetical protein